MFKKAISVMLAGVMMLSAVAGSRQKSLNADAAGPKSRVSVHDPSIYKADDGTYYVFGSHIEAAKSKDLQNWTSFANGYAVTNNVLFGNLSQGLKGAFDWAGENLEDCAGGFAVWAPDVIYNPDFINKDGTKGAYLMYFCTSSTYIRSVIGFASSKKLEGPYTLVDTLIYSGFTSGDSYATSSTKNVNRKYISTNVDELIASGQVTYNEQWFNKGAFNNTLFPNAIDPTIYYGTDGKMYMCYGSWSGGIFTLEIDKTTGKCIHPKTGTTSDGRMVDSYFGTKISGGYTKSGEGPFIEYNADTGYYYLWVTYGGLTAKGGYNMRVFRSKEPTGPFVDAAGRQAVLASNTSLDSIGLKVMGNYKFSSLNTAYMACGHNSVLRDDDGQWYLFNHARFNNGTEYHEVRVHSMYFNSEGWPVVAPYEYSGDKMAENGYNDSDIVGSYEYVNHGNDTSGTIHEYSKITLNADGTISGAVSGTWKQAEDSSAAVITIGNQRYDGYFLAAQDESNAGKKVMSFTAVGNNNQTVWGVKTDLFTGKEREVKSDYTNPDSRLIYNSETVSGTSGAKTIGSTKLLSGVSYKITNKFSGKVIDLPYGATDAGTNIQQWVDIGGTAQEWRIIEEDNGYCRIVSTSDESKCISLEANSADNGVNVCLAEYKGTDNQLWKIVNDGLSYAIVSKISDEKACLDVYDWSKEDGGNINQWEYWGGECQLWNITPVYPKVNNGDYALKNVNSGKWISADTDGNVMQSDNADIWTITENTDGTYSIVNSKNKALTVENGDSADGNNISVSAYSGSESQKFTIQCNKDGSYSLLTVVSGGKSCVDVFEISTASGANICQWNFWGGEGQKFVIEPTTPPSKTVLGDVNADGGFNTADLVMMQKYVLGSGILTDWEAGDLNSDSRINSADLSLMRKMLTDKQ